MSQPGDKKVDSGNDLVNLKVSYEHTSNGKLINNLYENFRDWSSTFTDSGVNKTDGKRLINLLTIQW